MTGLIVSEQMKLWLRRNTQLMTGGLVLLNLVLITQERLASPVRESFWSAVGGQSWLVFLVKIFTIIVAGGIIANEYNWGTLKLLLIRPVTRSQVLLAKYLTVMLFALCLLILLVGVSLLWNGLFYLTGLGGGADATPLVAELQWSAGAVFRLYLLLGVETMIYASIAFCCSVVVRSNAFAIGLTFFLMLFGSEFSRLFLGKTWGKWLLFNHSNLAQYAKSVPAVGTVNGLAVSLGVILAYLLVFYLIGWWLFTKRDVLH